MGSTPILGTSLSNTYARRSSPSLLEAEGIPCFAQGEEGQQLNGAGPVRLRVRLGDQEVARALLAHLEPTGPSEE